MGLYESKEDAMKKKDVNIKECKINKNLPDDFKKITDVSVKNNSVEHLRVYCDLCYLQNYSIKAAHLCQMCNRYLCTNCIHSHKHSSMLIDKESSPPIEITVLKCIKDIAPISKKDEDRCWITAMELLSTGDIVFVDGKNFKVKICRIEDCAVISEMILPSEPFDVAVVSKYEIGVTIPEQQQVQYLGTLNGLSKTRRMRVDGHCFGIARTHDLMALSFLFPEKVEIISNEGKILSRIETDRKGKEIFSAPYYVVFCNEGKHVYVSDHRKDSVMKFTVEGKKVASYKAGDLDRPEALVAIEDGSVVVVSRDNNCLHMISSHCNKIKILRGENNRLNLPWSICCSHVNKLLYIGDEEGRHITVYSY